MFGPFFFLEAWIVLVAPTGGVPHRTVDFIDCWVLALPIMPDCNNFLQNFSLISHKHASASCPSLLLSVSRTYVVPYQYFLPAMHARKGKHHLKHDQGRCQEDQPYKS